MHIPCETKRKAVCSAHISDTRYLKLCKEIGICISEYPDQIDIDFAANMRASGIGASINLAIFEYD